MVYWRIIDILYWFGREAEGINKYFYFQGVLSSLWILCWTFSVFSGIMSWVLDCQNSSDPVLFILTIFVNSSEFLRVSSRSENKEMATWVIRQCGLCSKCIKSWTWSKQINLLEFLCVWSLQCRYFRPGECSPCSGVLLWQVQPVGFLRLIMPGGLYPFASCKTRI